MQAAEIEEIVEVLLKAKDAYYNTANPIMEDDEFSSLEDLLRSEDPTNEYFSVVGAEVTGNKVAHEIPMGSLGKVQISEEKEIADLQKKFFSKEPACVSYKMDGCSIELVYENGNYSKGVTRGDGTFGEMIHSFDLSKDVLSSISPTAKTFIRGEAYFKETDFDAVNQILESQGIKKFANARNAVSGILNRDDAKMKEYLSFKAFDIITAQEEFDTKIEKLDFLRSLGFDTPVYSAMDWESFWELARDLNDNRKKLGYLIDGLVIDINNLAEYESLGVTDNKPKGAVALKFDPVSATTKVIRIVWQGSSTGSLTPVLEFEPIFVDGSTISRASLHNYTIFMTYDIGCGDIITVHKANDIIPQVKNVIQRSSSARETAPTACPTCTEPLTLRTRGITELVCTNMSCADKKEGAVSKWVSKSGMKSKGVGDAFIALFAQKYEPYQLYDLTLEDIKNLSSSYKDRSATIIYEAIQSSKELLLEDFFGGLNGESLGSRTFRKIINAKNCKSIYDVINVCLNYPIETIDGIGLITASDIKDFLNVSQKTIEEFNSRVSIIEIADSKGSFVFTGSFITIDPTTGKNYKRDALGVIAKSNGFSVEDSVKKGVTYLVTSDPTSVSSKMEKAKKLGVSVIGEDDFFAIMKS